MKLYEITIKPISGFGTPLKGDTLFGQFCWEIFQRPELIKGGIDQWLSVYDQKPFLVFSSAYPKLVINDSTFYVLKRPALPSYFMLKTEKIKDKEEYLQLKKHKKKKWLLFNSEDKTLDAERLNLIDDIELLHHMERIITPDARRSLIKIGAKDAIIHSPVPHNTINRLTNTTGDPPFGPYVMEANYYLPETELVILALIEEDAIDIEQVLDGLENMGTFGFGRDASIGMGRFGLGECEEITIFDPGDANACYILAPCVPEVDSFDKLFHEPFIRYGKHGNYFANFPNPFKNPVVMTNEGAVFIPKSKDIFDKPYLGRAITGVSKACENTVIQGYSPYIPMKLEIKNEGNI